MGKGKKLTTKQKRNGLLRKPGQGEREMDRVARSVGLNPVRQHPIGPFFADLAFPSRRVVIEVDGPTHVVGGLRDARRDQFFANEGWTVHRVPSTVAIAQPMAALISIFGVEPLRTWAAELQRIAANPPAPANLYPSHVPLERAKRVEDAIAPCPVRRLPVFVPLTSGAAREAHENHNRRRKQTSKEYRRLMQKIDRHQRMQRAAKKTPETPAAVVSADHDPGLADVGATMRVYGTKPSP